MADFSDDQQKRSRLIRLEPQDQRRETPRSCIERDHKRRPTDASSSPADTGSQGSKRAVEACL